MTAQLLTKGPEIGVVTTNLDAMVGFYRDFLGLEEQPGLEFKDGKMKRFAVGEGVLKLVTLNEDPTAEVLPGGLAAGRGFRYLTLVVSNVRELLEQAEAASVPVAAPLTEFSPGLGYFFLADPDGNWVEIAGPI